MHRRTLVCALGLLAGVQGWLPGQALAAAVEEAFACRHQQEERRVELRHAGRASRLPCQVVYWRDASDPDRGKPLWEAENDYGFCIEQTRSLLQRLEDGGWSCRKVAPAGGVATIPALAPRGAAAVPEPEPEPSRSVVSERGRLDAALARDLSRLAELSSPEARFEVAAAELGDLDHDGNADAAVLLTYHTGVGQPAQFLMAYRSEGETFRPAAKAYVGSLGAGRAASAIERIEDGTIELWFELREQNGDLARQRQTYVLEDDALIERRPES